MQGHYGFVQRFILSAQAAVWFSGCLIYSLLVESLNWQRGSRSVYGL